MEGRSKYYSLTRLGGKKTGHAFERHGGRGSERRWPERGKGEALSFKNRFKGGRRSLFRVRELDLSRRTKDPGRSGKEKRRATRPGLDRLKKGRTRRNWIQDLIRRGGKKSQGFTVFDSLEKKERDRHCEPGGGKK